MRCRTIQSRLTQGEEAPSAAGPHLGPQLRSHLETCSSCREFAARLKSARSALRQHDHEHEPDAGFSARVLRRLPSRERSAPDALGWAAWRLLPAALALVLALGGWSLVTSPSPTDLLAESASQDILSWVIETPEMLGTSETSP